MDKKNAQSVLYVAGGTLLALFGVVWAVWGPVSETVTYKVVEGMSIFAVLYVIAQGTERLTELVVSLLALLPGSPEERKTEALLGVRSANSTLNGNPSAEAFGDTVKKKAEKETVVDSARRDIAFFAQGFSITVAALTVNKLNYGLLSNLGAEKLDTGLDRLAAVLAAAGGTKALHELISRLQKSKEAAEAGQTK